MQCFHKDVDRLDMASEVLRIRASPWRLAPRVTTAHFVSTQSCRSSCPRSENSQQVQTTHRTAKNDHEQ